MAILSYLTVFCLGIESSFQDDNPRKRKNYLKFTTTLLHLFCCTSVSKSMKIQGQTTVNMDDNLVMTYDSRLLGLLQQLSK
jgi:hypothetical protein